MKITFELAKQADVRELLSDLREIDATDFAAWGVDPNKAVGQIMKASIYAVVGKVDGEVACIWGVMGASLLGSSGMLWMLTTNKADKATFRFARHSQQAVEKLLEIYPRLWGYVGPTNERSKRWLVWLKFNFGAPVELSGRQVLPFERIR